MRTRRSTGLDVIRALCLVFAAWPNCTRCCPTDGGGCQCNFAWQDCPPTSGCGGCGSSSSSSGCNAATADDPSGPMIGGDAGSLHHALGDATVVEETGGTLAFVTTDAGTFAIATVAPNDEARVFRIDANELDEDALTVRPVATLAFDDHPGRVVADHGRALVALRNTGVVAAIDPLTLSVVDRRPTCAMPGPIAAGDDAVWIACAHELVTLRRDTTELRRSALEGDFHVMIASNGALAATDGTKWRALEGALEPTLPASVSDVAMLDDTSAYVDGDDAYLDGKAVSPGLVARAVALADVHGEKTTRRVLALQTTTPRLLVFFDVTKSLVAGPIEPLE